MSELEQLAQVCQRLGAPAAQAQTMAAQLLKRAAQLSAERGTTRETELARLMEIVVKGRQGVVPESFTPPAPRSPQAGLSAPDAPAE
jgi:hypothetical protein